MSDATWDVLYPALRSLACYLVHTSPLPYWHGQEEDMAEDIVQETVRRVIERAQKAERARQLLFSRSSRWRRRWPITIAAISNDVITVYLAWIRLMRVPILPIFIQSM